MRKLEPNNMYHKIKLLILFILLLTSCNTVKKSTRAKTTNSFAEINSVSSLQFSKVILRINTDGFLRTHKTSISYLSDSIISINIFSNLNRQLAHVIFDSKGLKFYEKLSGVGYFYSYKYLSSAITYPISFNFVRDLLFGFSPLISVTPEKTFETGFFEFNNRNNLSLSFSLQKNDYGFPVLFEIESFKPIIKLSFASISYQNLQIPEYLSLALNFNDKLFEFEVEYNFDKLVVNKEVSFNFDSSFPLNTFD